MLFVRVISDKITEDSDTTTIVDDQDLPLRTSVFTILESAYDTGCQKITIPLLRITSDSDFITTMRAVLDIKEGIFDFKKTYPESNLMVNIVVTENKELRNLIKNILHDYL